MMPTDTTITILVDNQAGEGLVAEHGLSLWIEVEGEGRILFDTGQGGALPRNAGALGIDVSSADVLVLSHGHYDHTGGIPYTLQRAPGADVYCHRGAMHPRYSIRKNALKTIQMPGESTSAIRGLPLEQIHWVDQPLLLSDKIGVTGPIPRETSYEDTGGPFYLDPAGKQADPIEDDLALWIRTNEGVIVCVGCSHAGLVNTLHYVIRLNSGLKIRAVIGGFHLLNARPKRLKQTADALQLLELETVIPCHCTGESAVSLLRDSLGTLILPGAAGTTLQF